MNIRTVAVERKHQEQGTSAVEYGLMVAAIAGVIVAIVFTLGGFVKGLFIDTCDSLNSQPVGGVTRTCN